MGIVYNSKSPMCEHQEVEQARWGHTPSAYTDQQASGKESLSHGKRDVRKPRKGQAPACAPGFSDYENRPRSLSSVLSGRKQRRCFLLPAPFSTMTNVSTFITK